MAFPVAGASSTIAFEAESFISIPISVSGTGKLLVLSFHRATVQTFFGVTLRGVGDLTFMDSVGPGGDDLLVWKYEDPPDGSQWVDISMGSMTGVAGLQLFTGAVRTPMTGSIVKAYNTGAASSQVEPDTESEDLAIDMCVARITTGWNPTLAPGPGQTESYEIEEPVSARRVLASSWAQASGSTTPMLQTPTPSPANLAHMAFAVKGPLVLATTRIVIPGIFRVRQSGNIRMST